MNLDHHIGEYIEKREYVKDGWDISCYMLENLEVVPTDFDGCDMEDGGNLYTQDDIERWNNNEFKFVDLIFFASRFGIVFGTAYVEAIEHGIDEDGDNISAFDIIENFEPEEEVISIAELYLERYLEDE